MSEEEQSSTHTRHRSHSLYGAESNESPLAQAPSLSSSSLSSNSRSSESPSPSPRRRSSSGGGGTRSNSGNGDGNTSNKSRGGGGDNKKGGLSAKTLNIVNNLQSVREGGREKEEEVEEERRLAAEEKRKQAMVHNAVPYANKDAMLCDHVVKLLLIGDSGVGKTSLLLRYSELISPTSSSSLLSTAGVDFKVRHLTIDGKRIKVQIWDTAGQERFHVITRTFFKGAHGIVIIYDLTDNDSFKNVNYWMANIQQHADGRVSKLLVGNKSDLPERQITRAQGESLSGEYGFKHFYETSAKTGENVNEAFDELATEIVKRMEKEAQVQKELEEAGGVDKNGRRRGSPSSSKGNVNGQPCCIA